MLGLVLVIYNTPVNYRLKKGKSSNGGIVNAIDTPHLFAGKILKGLNTNNPRCNLGEGHLSGFPIPFRKRD